VEAMITRVHRRILIALDVACQPKKYGGISMKNIRLWNKAIIAKHVWDITKKEDKLWFVGFTDIIQGLKIGEVIPHWIYADIGRNCKIKENSKRVHTTMGLESWHL